MKKIFKIALFSVLGLVAVFGVLTWLEFAPLVKGALSAEKLDEAIAAVSQPERANFLGTAWTMVMDLTHPSVTYYSRRHFDKPFHFELKKQ